MTASSDTNRPGNPGGPRTPETGKTVPPAVTPAKASAPTGTEPPKVDAARTEPGKTEPGRTDPAKTEPGKSEFGKSDAAKVEAVKAELGKVDPSKPEPSKTEPGKQEAAKAEPPRPGGFKAEGTQAEGSKPDAAKTDSLKPDPAKPDPAKPEASRTSGFGAAPGTTPRPNAAVTDGPIIDLKAKRLPDPPPATKPATGGSGAPTGATSPAAGTKPSDLTSAGAAAAGFKAGDSKTTDGKPADAKPAVGTSEPAKPAAGATPRITPAPEAPSTAASRGPGFGSIATAGLLGGVIGAGLLFGVQRAGLVPPQDDGRLAALDQRIAALAPRDELAGLDKRVAANESALKAVPEAVATAKQALQKVNATPVAPTDGVASPPAAAPADLVARLDSLDQRVSALQEEPGQQGGDATRLVATQTGAVTALDERVKALEGKVETGPKAAQPDLTPKLAALQSEVDARTKANAEANAALGQKLTALQQALDERVKAATEAVQAATAASQQAVDAGKTQAAETAKAVERQLQVQSDKIAGLDKAVSARAETATVQAALRVVSADRIATALNSGAPYADALTSLRNLEPGDPARLTAVAVFADKGAPTARGLAAEFRPIAEKIAAARRAAQSRSVAESGDFGQKLMSMADSIIQVRKVDTPAATGTAGVAADPTTPIQEALDRGDIEAAAKAFAGLPEDVRAQAGEFGTRLTSRAAAGAAAQGLLADAFKAIPAPAASR